MMPESVIRELIGASENLKATLDHETQHLPTANPEDLKKFHHAKVKKALIYEARVNTFFQAQPDWEQMNPQLREALVLVTQTLQTSMQENERILRDAIEINRRFIDVLVATFEDARMPAQVYDARGRMNPQRRRLPNLSVTVDQQF
jgi:flagellar biosynthesis/type III secretory pathway chaperone